jgi:hypothetical protein
MDNYFTQPQPGLGGVSWTMGLVWVLGLAAGIYLLTQWRESNPVRYHFGRLFGIVTVVLSALGIVQLALRFFEVPTVEWRLWSYLLALATLGFWGWGIYYSMQRLPAQAAAARRSMRGAPQRGARTYAANGSIATSARPQRQPRPEATTSRREARRERKRRSR